MTTWTRYRHKEGLITEKERQNAWYTEGYKPQPKFVEYDVETISGRPVVYTGPTITGPEEKCHRVRTVANYYYEEKGRHIPQFTFMPAERFKELYERV